MTPQTGQELKALFKKIALICVILGVIAAVFFFVFPTPGMQMLTMAALVIASGISGYRCAAVSQLWTAAAWLKGVLCLFAVLAGVVVGASAFWVGGFGYIVATGKTSGSSSGGGWSSSSFD